jgi:hypothetical protein
MTHKCVIVQVGEPNKKKIGKFIHILVAEVAVVSLQLLLTAVTFTKCYHTLTCSHCTEFWRHVLAVTSSSAERTLSRVRIIKNRLSTSIASGVVEGDAVGWHPQIIWTGMASPK